MNASRSGIKTYRRVFIAQLKSRNKRMWININTTCHTSFLDASRLFYAPAFVSHQASRAPLATFLSGIANTTDPSSW